MTESIEIPEKYIFTGNLENFIEQIYPDLNTQNPTFADKAILTLFNVEATKINTFLLSFERWIVF